MAKINYQYEKRQKDLAKKKKREEKRLKRLNKNAEIDADKLDTPIEQADDDATDSSKENN